MKSTEERLPLTVLCAELGVDYLLAYRAALRGLLSVERVGGRLYVTRRELRRFASALRPAAGAAQ